MNIPHDEVRPGETLDQLGRVELWGSPKDPADYARMKQEFTKLVRQLAVVATRHQPRIELDLRPQTQHSIGKLKFAMTFVGKLILLALLLPILAGVMPIVSLTLFDEFNLVGSEPYLFGAGLITWFLSAILLFTRIGKRETS